MRGVTIHRLWACSLPQTGPYMALKIINGFQAKLIQHNLRAIRVLQGLTVWNSLYKETADALEAPN